MFGSWNVEIQLWNVQKLALTWQRIPITFGSKALVLGKIFNPGLVRNNILFLFSSSLAPDQFVPQIPDLLHQFSICHGQSPEFCLLLSNVWEDWHELRTRYKPYCVSIHRWRDFSPLLITISSSVVALMLWKRSLEGIFHCHLVKPIVIRRMLKHILDHIFIMALLNLEESFVPSWN